MTKFRIQVRDGNGEWVNSNAFPAYDSRTIAAIAAIQAGLVVGTFRIWLVEEEKGNQ